MCPIQGTVHLRHRFHLVHSHLEMTANVVVSGDLHKEKKHKLH